jgi:hypothetical protein
MKAERDRRLKTGEGEAYKKAKPVLEEVELDEVAPGFEVYTDPKSGKPAVRRTPTAVAPKPTKATKTSANDDNEAWKEKNAARRKGRVYHEEVELDEVSDKKLDAYRQKAFADQPAGDDGSDKYRKRKFGRDLAFAKQTGRAKVLATWQAKKVAEAKDPNEYDKEGDMMKNQLRQICSANEKLMKMVGDDDNLPEWVQNKVTKATDYIRSVRDYLDAEDSDEDESMEESVTISPLQKIRMDKEKADRNKDDKDKSQAKRMTDKQYAGYKVKMKEEVEELDELSKKTLGSYVKKAKDDLGNREAEVTRNRYVDPRGVADPVKHNNKLLMKRANRRDNINKAVDKLTKEEAVQSADRKPEKYIRPDGKVGIRMVKVDKKVIKND